MTTVKISKFKSKPLPNPQLTITTKGALNSAVWIEGAMQWNNAKLIWLSTQISDAQLTSIIGDGLPYASSIDVL